MTKNTMKTAIIYIPTGPNANPCWEAVREALEDAGVKDIRPAPMPPFNPISLPVMVRGGEI